MTSPASQANSGTREGSALLARAGFVVLLVYVVFLGGGYVGTQATILRVIDLGLVTIVLVAWAYVAWGHPSWRPRSVIWPAFAFPIVALAIATVLSWYPRLGIEYLAWAVLLAAMYLLLVRVLDIESVRDRIGGWAALLGFLVGLQYLSIVVVAWLDTWLLAGRITEPTLRPAYAGLTFGGPTVVAPVMVLITAAAFGGLSPSTKARSIVLLALACVMVAVVILTGTRASWLALCMALAVVGVALLVVHRRRVLGALSGRQARRLMAAACCLMVPLALVTAPALISRLSSPSDGGRSQYIAAALRMFRDSPWVGTGTGTWATLRASYTQPGEVDFYVNHAHNIYVQTLAETGVMGAAAFIVLVAVVGLLVLAGIRSRDAALRRWGWAAAFGLVYLAAHSMLDFYANMPVVMLAAAIPVAALDARIRSLLPSDVFGVLDARRGRAIRRMGSTVFWASCVLAIVVLARVESVALIHDDAVRELRTSDWDGALASATDASVADPDMIPYHVARGMAASALGDWPLALEAYERAARVDDLPANWLGLAQAQIHTGRPAAEVQASLARALRLGAAQPAVAFAAGTLYDRIGMPDAADDAYIHTLMGAPSLAGDPMWTETMVGDANRWRAIVEAAAESLGPVGWQVRLMAGLSLPEPLPSEMATGSSSLPMRLVDAAWNGDAAALDEIRALAEARPTDVDLLGWVARISRRAGDDASAMRYARLASYADEWGLAGSEVRIGGTALDQRAYSSANTAVYGQMLYRRMLPNDLMPPGLPRLVAVSDG